MDTLDGGDGRKFLSQEEEAGGEEAEEEEEERFWRLSVVSEQRGGGREADGCFPQLWLNAGILDERKATTPRSLSPAARLLLPSACKQTPRRIASQQQQHTAEQHQNQTRQPPWLRPAPPSTLKHSGSLHIVKTSATYMLGCGCCFWVQELKTVTSEAPQNFTSHFLYFPTPPEGSIGSNIVAERLAMKCDWLDTHRHLVALENKASDSCSFICASQV